MAIWLRMYQLFSTLYQALTIKMSCVILFGTIPALIFFPNKQKALPEKSGRAFVILFLYIIEE
jgi:hypothetical protein